MPLRLGPDAPPVADVTWDLDGLMCDFIAGHYQRARSQCLSRNFAPLAVRMDAYTGHVSAVPATLVAMRRTLKPMPSGHAEGFRDYVAAAGLTDLAHWINALPRDEDFALERIDIPIAGLRTLAERDYA